MKIKNQCFLLLLVISCFQNMSLAHSPHECYFDIKMEKQSCTITAEFPWTLRNALLALDPTLKNAQAPQAFKQTFEKYISSHLILKDKEGKMLIFKGFRALESSGHSHQNEYVLEYEGGNIHQVTNTIMFEMSDKQSNYHSIMIDGTKRTFETYKGQDSFIIDNLSTNNTPYFIFGFVVIGIIGIVTYKYWTTAKKHSKTNVFEN
jgi:hypothetical protein